MKRSFLLLTLFVFSNCFALDHELSGNLEVQSRRAFNNEESRRDLFQDWHEENFHLAYGNLNGIVQTEHFKIESNLFLRHSISDLYNPSYNMFRGDAPYAATQIYSFPNTLVARDVFKLQYNHQQNNYKTDAVLNKLFIEWNYDEHRVNLGRIYVNYGLGETFNPVNPFNQPTGLTSISQVAQGSDGGMISFFMSDNYTIDFLLLGDKKIENYEGQIDRTLWIHGEYQATEKLQLDYVIGEDQNRQKVGGQMAYRFEEAMVFTQILYQSHLVNKKPSHNLWDVMLGYDQQVTSKWHIRGEAGYQKENLFATNLSFGDRFLPTEYFIALANVYEIHPLVKLSGTVINDIKSGFTYLIGKSTYSFKENLEAELFGYVPAAKGDAADNIAQKLVTTDVGVALRAFF
jgi:hypothetical protein